MTLLKFPKAFAAQSLVGSVLAVLANTPAMARSYTNLSISAGGKIASNPFLQTAGAGSTSGQAVSIEVTPTFRTEGASAALTFHSNFRLDQYLKDNGSDFAANVGADLTNKFSSKTTLNARASYHSSRTTLRDILFLRDNPATNPNLTPGTLVDPTLIGSRRRTNSWNVGLGITTQPNRRDSISLYASLSQQNTPALNTQDYRYLSLQGSLSHQLNARTSLQFSLVSGNSTYLRQRVGSGSTLTPMAGFTTRLNSSFTLSALAGSTISKIDRGDGTKVTNTTWAAQASVCQKKGRDALCLSGSRQIQPTANGGVRSATSASLDYTRQLNERNTLSLGVTLNQSGRETVPALNGANTFGETRYIIASSSLSHRFNQRFVGFFTPSLEHIKSNGLSPRLEYQINFGVRYIIGENR